MGMYEAGEKDRNIPNNRRLADTNTSNESSSVDRTEVAPGTTAHEDGDAGGPGHAEDTGGPKTADAVANRERTGCRLANCEWERIRIPYIRAPATEPIWTMAETLALMSACSETE